MSKMTEIARRRREYVNQGFAREVTGTHLSLAKKRKIFKRLWREAKRKYPSRR